MCYNRSMEYDKRQKKREYDQRWVEQNKDKVLGYYKKYYSTHKEQLSEYQRKYRAGLSPEVKRRRLQEYRRRWKAKYPEKYRAQRIKWREYCNKLKELVLTHYGGNRCACVMCGEARSACLSIDHIDGGGRAHGRETKCTGNPFYLWLRRHGLPKGYQTLCMNCQWVKRVMNGECAKRY